MEITDEAKQALKKHDKKNRKRVTAECEVCGDTWKTIKPKVLKTARYMCSNCYFVDDAKRKVREMRHLKGIEDGQNETNTDT